jgi:hypothetical protein
MDETLLKCKATLKKDIDPNLDYIKVLYNGKIHFFSILMRPGAVKAL